MVAKVCDETLVYGLQSLTLHEMRGEFCPSCGEGLWDRESYRRYTEAQAALVRATEEDVSADIRRIRKNLKLTQAELAEAFGVAKVAFSRYERGETRPRSRSSSSSGWSNGIPTCWRRCAGSGS
jgi:HTH-type transcriptional regulator/antitoxin MqsA